METLYNIAINAAEKILPVSGLFSDKMKLFVRGRKSVFETLKAKIHAEDKTIWIHTASLGEYEQAVPVIEQLKKDDSGCKILVTFFSPSGYEPKKNSKLADVIVYLPLDTKKNVEEFLDLVHPVWAIFIKYEFWPNYLKALQRRSTKTLLVSGSFRKDQPFFKAYGRWMQKYLHSFEHFFVQDEKSKRLLNSIGFRNVTISGDTRFDRVSHQLEYDNNLSFIEKFKGNSLCVVAGSTWPEDEELIIEYINTSPQGKFIIAPHTFKPGRITELRNKLHKKTLLYSEMQGKDPSLFDVFIIDTIGLLSKIYSYADVAYVGGAAGNTGLHNILEPATFGLPVIIGKNYAKFPEAKELRKLAGLFSIATKEEFSEILQKLLSDKIFRDKTGQISGHYIQSGTGATKVVMDYIHNNS